jgi:uncharacterized membrane protein (DUF485 family)
MPERGPAVTETLPTGHTPESEDPEYHLPKDHWPLPELTTLEQHPHPSLNRYVATRDAAEFQKLRALFRNFAFPTVAAVVVWYFIYVLASTYAVELMSTPAFGALNVGMVIGLAQFPTTWFATWLYLRHANRRLDPLAASLRAQLEGEAQA